MTWITPCSQDTDFCRPLKFEDKVRIFKERTLGWQIDIAEACINGRTGCDGAPLGPIKHSGYAVLQIVLSYFEMIAKLKDGFVRPSQSQSYFRAGVRDVFPALASHDATVVDDVLSILYGSARCGLYHAGMTEGRVVLLGEGLPALTYDQHRRRLIVNPHNLVPVLRQHLLAYVNDLKDPAKVELRENFERRFDHLMRSDPLSSRNP